MRALAHADHNPAEAPAAAERLPVLRPQLPKTAQLLPYLEQIDANRWYTNHGPLMQRLRSRLGAHYGLAPTQTTLVSNGTAALTAALLAMDVAPGSRCLMPSWTFIGTAAAAIAAQMRPHFVDVEPDSWALDPAVLARRQDLGDVGAVIVVSPFGAPIDRAAWDRFTADTGIPVLIDAAAAFDTVASIEAAGPGKTPIMISLHATKAFGIGEGGLLLATDPAFNERAEQFANFGFLGSADATVSGGNAKLSEYHAAVGQAMLDDWDKRRRRLAEITNQYIERLRGLNQVSLSPGYGEGWVSSYCCVLVDDATGTAARLAERGIETRRWWRRGCHNHPAYASVPSDALPVTDNLASRMLGLPFYVDLTPANLDRIVGALAEVQ